MECKNKNRFEVNRRVWRELAGLPLLLRGFVVLALMFSANTGNASRSDLNNWINHAEAGVFLLRSDDGEALAATTLNTEAEIDITGPIARIAITQRFRNQGRDFVEGTYVFPLSERASVRAMEMQVGERVIVGEIHEKQEAARVYAQAKSEGKRAALVEQRRPNVFTSTVANIAPGEEIAVKLEYIEILPRESNQYSLRLPMTLTPRYRPEIDQGHVEAGEKVFDSADPKARVPDVSGPFSPIGSSSNDHKARIRIRLNSGVQISQLYSRSHQILSTVEEGQFQITPRDLQVPMDRDFLMSWTLTPANGTAAALFTETVAGDEYALITLVPPLVPSEQSHLAKEMLFIIDTSGSMGGESIRQAKLALQSGLKRLYPGDRFNIIEFNSEYQLLFPQSLPVSENTIHSAQRFVQGLEAGGGTEILAPLMAALRMPSSGSFLRQLVFITDGAVANEKAIFKALHEELGTARLFTVGIGSAPNSYFMRKSAEFGRGSFTYISNVDDVEVEMSALFSRLEKPLMRDLSLAFPEGVEAEIFPSKIPDLYAGEPLTVALRFSQLPEWITVKGNGREAWEQRLSSDGAGAGQSGLSSLWAREKIESLMDRLTLGEAEATLRPEIIDVSLRHKILSPYTSFVAVDHTPVRLPEQRLEQQSVSNLPPNGMAWPKTALGLTRLWWYAAGLLVACIFLMWRVRRVQYV